MGYWWQQLRKNPTRLLVTGFAVAILVGGGLLTLPVSAAGTRIGFLDALFTATSAVCVTGLTVRDTGSEYSTFGHVVILLLIQLGGLGITTLSTTLFLFFGQRASLSTHDVVQSSFRARPEGKLKPLLIQVFVWTVAIEAAGAAILLPSELSRRPPLQAAWNATFHAVSVFCNAGFSLRSDSLMGDRANPAVILPIAGLIILGGLGFGVLTELGENLRTRVCGQRPKRFSLHARTALATTGILLLVGMLGFLLLERRNLLDETNLTNRFLTSFFASVTARTAGFNSILGYHFACELHQLGHEVLAVDADQDTVQQILPHVTKAAVADVSDRPALEELAIADFDIVAVCVGERLETAVLLVHHLHQMHVPRIIVKVANVEQAEIVKLVGASEVIQPDQSAARKAALLIHHPRTADYLELGDGHLVIAGRPPGSIIGKPAGELGWQERFGVSLLAVWQPGQQGPPAPPTPDRPIAETDILILAGHIDRLRELRRVK